MTRNIDMAAFNASAEKAGEPEDKSKEIPISRESIDAGAEALYRALPDAFPWRSSAARDVAVLVFLAMVEAAPDAVHDAVANKIV